MRVLVAGGVTGIGAAAVRALLDRGDQVVVADLAAPADSLPSDPALTQVRADFSHPAAAAEVATRALEALGTLDALFYNAAVLESRPLAAWDRVAWDRSLAVNLTAPFLLTQALAPELARSDCGRVILTASTGALRGHAGMPAYHATKSGLLGLVRSLADELGPTGTTVNAVCPGWVVTPFNDPFWDSQSDPAAAQDRLVAGIPLGRQAEPEDLTGTILFLASPASRYITGQSIVVDGGYTAV